MNHIKIVNWLMDADNDSINEIKKILSPYISFYFIEEKNVTKQILCEKICDYIETTMIKHNVSFNQLVKHYMVNLGDIVDDYLPMVEIGKKDKGKIVYGDSRALKYFKVAKEKRNNKDHPFRGMEDYSRIVFCLYSEIIKNNRTPITDFDYSFSSINCLSMIKAFETEKKKKILKNKPDNRFQLDEKYSMDSIIIIMTVIVYYHLKSKEIKGDY